MIRNEPFDDPIRTSNQHRRNTAVAVLYSGYLATQTNLATTAQYSSRNLLPQLAGAKSRIQEMLN